MKWLSKLRQDGWTNTILGFGQVASDRRMSSFHSSSYPPSREEYESLYNEDGLACRIVQLPVVAAFQNGYDVVYSGEMDAIQKEVYSKQLKKRLKDLDVLKCVKEAAFLGRLFGGAALLIVTDDADWSEPLDPKNPGNVLGFRVYDRYELYPVERYNSPQSPQYEDIASYDIMSSGYVSDNRRVHATRLIMFGGAHTSRQERARLGYWDHSVLRRVMCDIRDHALTWGSVANMVLDCSVGVLKIHNFIGVLAGGLKEQFDTRLEILNTLRNSSRVMPMDTREDFQHQERTFSGLEGVLDRQMQRVSSVTGIPVCVLYGRSPAGLNATGESDIRQWYDLVAETQKNLTAPLERIVQLISADLWVMDSAVWQVEWPSLWQETTQERTERQEKIAGMDVAYIDAGVLTADEVALARFGSGVWSDEAPQLGSEVR